MTESYDSDPDRLSLFHIVLRERGFLWILVVSLFLSLGIGSVIGLVPDTLADRYARLHHGWSGEHCSNFDEVNMPVACQKGSDEAQLAASFSNLALNLLCFVFNPVIGSVSDAHGRRGMILLSLFLSMIPAFVFFVAMNSPQLHPLWYYTANAAGGWTYFLGVAFALLSDVIPDQCRTTSYGLLLACFYGGFAIGPSISMLLTHYGVSLASLSLMGAAFVVALFFLPETLADHVREENIERLRAEYKGSGPVHLVSHTLSRPFRDISILNRDYVIRLLVAGSFFSSMVYASDVTLVVYYIEEHLNVRDGDIARMFLTFGMVGILLQGFLIQPLVTFFGGEKNLLIATFLCGACHNSLYGLARGKETILMALILAQFTKLNFPILSSLASQGASVNEQGRLQGALFASNALASAFGPLSMEYVYSKTKDCSWGPGTMFYYAALLQVIGTITVSFIPSKRTVEDSPLPVENEAQTDLEEPLIPNRIET